MRAATGTVQYRPALLNFQQTTNHHATSQEVSHLVGALLRPAETPSHPATATCASQSAAKRSSGIRVVAAAHRVGSLTERRKAFDKLEVGTPSSPGLRAPLAVFRPICAIAVVGHGWGAVYRRQHALLQLRNSSAHFGEEGTVNRWVVSTCSGAGLRIPCPRISAV